MALTIYRIGSSAMVLNVRQPISSRVNPSCRAHLTSPTNSQRILCPAVRNCVHFSTKSSSSKEPLHQVLQRNLLKNDTSQMTTSQRAILKFSTDGKQSSDNSSPERSSNHHYTSLQERSRMQQQAIINGLIAFSVVILACQNLKAGVEKRQMQEQLQQQEAQCHAVRQILREIVQRQHMESLASQIVQELEAPRRPSFNARWFPNQNSRDSTLDHRTEQHIADRLERHFQSIVGDSALDESERDLKKVQALTTPSELSLTVELDKLSDSLDMDDILAALQNESNDESAPKIVKKRIFSM